jgi:hypothetical protein
VGSLIVTLRSPLLAEDADLRLPGDVPLARLLPELAAALGLPVGEYCLLHQARRLSGDETLFGAGVLTADVLLLQPECPDGDGAPPEKDEPAEVSGAPREIHLADLVPSQVARARVSAGRVTAFWSGPAGGTGRTTLALAASTLAAERNVDALLLALSEPSVSVALRLPRLPNVMGFFATGSLGDVEQAVGWEGESGRAKLPVVLGPARPTEGTVKPGQVEALLAAARASHALTCVDLPALAPGENPWVLEPLSQVEAVVLVVGPTAVGVAAVVEALAVLRDVKARAEVHLALVRRAPGGLATPEFASGVQALWGACPPPIEVPYLSTLPEFSDRGELPGAGSSRCAERARVPALASVSGPAKEELRWAQAVERLAQELFKDSFAA